MNSPVYVKAGFGIALTMQMPALTEWFSVSGHSFNRPVLVADLPNFPGPKPNLIEWPVDSLNHYTILSQFMLTEAEFLTEGSWGLLVGGLLGCWEIYLNGQLLHANLPIKEDGRSLRRQCQMRSLLLEVDRSRIKLGENLLAFHIVGDRNSANLGLYPGNPLLVDKYTNLSRNNTEYSLIALLAVYLAIGLYHLILSIGRRHDKKDFYFGIFCVVLVMYNVTRSNFIFAFIPDPQILARLEYALVFIVIIPFLRFLDLVLYNTWTRFSRMFSVFVSLLAIAVLIPGPLRIADTILRTWQVGFLFALAYFVLVHGRRPVHTTLLLVWNQQVNVGVGRKILRTIIETLGQTVQGNLLLGILTLVVSATWDILDSIYFRTGIGLVKYGFAIFVIGIAVSLAKHTQKMHSDIEKLNENLENQIKVEVHLKESFARFVPKHFLRILGKRDIPDVHLGDYSEREMTIMFADIRSFTSISEKLTPKQTFEFINNYLKGAGPIIRKYGGFIDKYMGDGIMALFEKPEAAIQAAVKLQDRNARISRTLREKMAIPLRVGIGIHTGHLMLGTIGEHQRMDGTVIADAVNLASRVESLTKQYGAEILATEITLQKFRESGYGKELRFRFLDRIAVKGKQEPTVIYAVLRPELQEGAVSEDLLRAWESALKLYYDRDFHQAALAFKAILAKATHDKPTALYLSRCVEYIQTPPKPEWGGVAVATAK